MRLLTIIFIPLICAQLKAQVVEFDTTEFNLFRIKDFPITKFKPKCNIVQLAILYDGNGLSFVSKNNKPGMMASEIVSFNTQELEVPFVNLAKMNYEPKFKNDTISFSYGMPNSAAEYSIYFLFSNENKDSSKIAFLYSKIVDPSVDEIRLAEVALENYDIKGAVDHYNAVQYPMHYLNEEEVAFNLMQHAHRVALIADKENDPKMAAEYMRQALEFYGNEAHLRYKNITEFDSAHPDIAPDSWSKEYFKLWIGDYGLFLLKAKRLEESIEINEHLTSLFPNVAGPYLQLADSYFDSGNYTEAFPAYKAYISIMKANKKDKLIPKRVKERIKK